MFTEIGNYTPHHWFQGMIAECYCSRGGTRIPDAEILGGGIAELAVDGIVDSTAIVAVCSVKDRLGDEEAVLFVSPVWLENIEALRSPVLSGSEVAAVLAGIVGISDEAADTWLSSHPFACHELAMSAASWRSARTSVPSDSWGRTTFNTTRSGPTESTL